MKGPKVVITDGAFPGFEREKEILSQVGARLSIAECRTEEEVITAAQDADALLVQWAPITRRVVSELKRCRIIGRYGLGVDMIDMQAATDRGIVVANAGDYCVREVAQHTVAMILSCARKLHIMGSSVREGCWDTISAAGSMRRFEEMNCGIFGYGLIGQLVAESLHVLGFSILVYDPYRAEVEDSAQRVDLETLLQDSDFLSIHAPLTNETRGFFNRERIRQMKKTAFLVNTARGAIIDTAALGEALARNEIAGAALDVFAVEPPSAGDPLLLDPRVLVTPHAAYYSLESLQSLQRNPAEELVRFFRGEPLRWALNAPALRGDSG